MNHIKCPSRSSWLRTLLLILSRIIVVLLLVGLLNSLPRGPIRTLVNIGGWIGFSALMGVWSHFISVFKKETKFWKIQTTSVVEIVDALKISFLSDLIAIGLGLFSFFVSTSVFKLNKEDSETLLGLLVLLILVIWFFSIPLLYEKTLIKRNLKTQSKVKAKTKFNKK
jgi:hypothetical protein